MNYTVNNSVHSFSTSGGHGKNGVNGASGSDWGNNGCKGQDGGHGAHASALTITLKAAGGNAKVCANGQTTSLKLSDRNISIDLKACGGNGGKGGKGGNGANGCPGENGKNATRFSSGTNGEDGGDGGDGGNGGRGGNGGNGGNITLRVSPDDADLLMLTNTPDIQGGKGGVGGNGGNGGNGGPGGKGGSSKSWTTGSGDSQVSHYKSGGWSGRDGWGGRRGEKARDGANGSPGSYCIEMGTERFKDRYNMSVLSCNMEDDNGDGIFEPGEQVSVGVALKNNGGMKLPTAQGTRVSIVNNSCLSFESASTIYLPRGLGAGKRYSPAEKLRFCIAKRHEPVVGEPLGIDTKVKFRVTVERVERHFSQVEAQFRSFKVQYPAKLRRVRQVDTISRDEEALFSVRADNISNAALGSGSDGKRVTTLKLRVQPNETASGVCFFSKEGENTPGECGLTESVTYLTPGTGTTLSGSLKFIDPALPPYSRVKLCASLELGILAEPDNEQHAKPVQLREFEVQLADLYEQQQADFLLITNGNTLLDEITCWHSLSDALGLKFSVWNSSLYNGVSFVEHKFAPGTGHPLGKPANTGAGQPCCSRADQHSLIDHFQNKTAVFLNYPGPSGKTATSTMPSMELNNCTGYPNNLKCFFIGNTLPCNLGGMELNDDLYYPNPEQLETKIAKEKRLVNRYLLFSNAKKRRLEKAAQKLARKFGKKHPGTRVCVVYNYMNEQQPSSYWACKKRLVGTMQVCPSFVTSNYIYRHMLPGTENQLDSVAAGDNVFGLLKSLTMAKKIDLVINKIENYTREHKVFLRSAILDDLVNEYYLFSKIGESLDKNGMKRHLILLQEVVSANYENECAEQFILDLLVEFRAFAGRMATRKNIVIKRRLRRLTIATKKIIDDFFSRLHFDKNSWKATYSHKKRDFQWDPKYILWKNYLPSTINPSQGYFGKCRNWVLDMDLLKEVHNNPRPSTVVEQGHIYHSPQARLQALEQLETYGSLPLAP